MSVEIKVPVLPESVADALLLDWNKKVGDAVSRDEILIEVETDKVVLEVPSPVDGVLTEILIESGATVVAEQLIGKVEEGAAAASSASSDSAKPASEEEASTTTTEAVSSGNEMPLSPAVRRLVEENNVDISGISGTGRDGRLVKQDVQDHLNKATSSTSSTSPKEQSSTTQESATAASDHQAETLSTGGREEKREPMTRLRRTIANRLVQSQQNAALLTTFNEVNMQPVMELRKKYKESFEKKHGAKLGFMSFFVKASVAALQKFPLVNAYIDGTDIVQHYYNDIGIAVSSPRGLLVPILRNCETMSFSDIEGTITSLGEKAREGKIGIEDMTGGTFTITNGGVFGSLLSTPIVNPPQSAILGMHKIQERPMAENGEVVVRPMMYLALSYDHRIIDGKEAVQFLVTIKDMLEDPARLMLDC